MRMKNMGGRFPAEPKHVFASVTAGELIIAVVYGLRLARTDSLDLASNIIHWIASLIPSYPVADVS